MIRIPFFVVACVIFIMLDTIWLYTNRNYYLDLAFKIQKEPFVLKLPAFPIVYICLFTSLYFCIRFIELEITNKKNFYLKAIAISALFGVAVYGIFSYTVCIFLKNYSYTNAFIDTIWAIVLYSVPTVIYFALKNNYKKMSLDLDVDVDIDIDRNRK